MLEKGSFFGHSKLLKFLFNNTNTEWQKEEVEVALKNAVMADDPDCVQIIRDFWQNKTGILLLNDEIKKEALKRGKSEILNILDVSFQKETIFKIPNFPFNFNLVPKSEEFEYVDVMEMLKNILDQTPWNANSQRLITYQKLLEELHVGQPHDPKSQRPGCRQSLPVPANRELQKALIANRLAAKKHFGN